MLVTHDPLRTWASDQGEPDSPGYRRSGNVCYLGKCRMHLLGKSRRVMLDPVAEAEVKLVASKNPGQAGAQRGILSIGPKCPPSRGHDERPKAHALTSARGTSQRPSW